MFEEQKKNRFIDFGKYLIGSFFIIMATFIGQLPLILAIQYTTKVKGIEFPKDDSELFHFFEPNLNLFLILISFVFSLFGIYFVVRFFHHQTLLSIITTRTKIDWKRILFSFLIWAAFIILSTALSVYLNPNDFIVNFQPIPFLILTLIGIVLIPIQTTVEELVFRGYLMQGFGFLINKRWFPLFMTSMIFGLMHLSNPEVTKMGHIVLLYYIGTGFFLGILTLMDQGMELSLGFHAANNLIGALLVTTEWTIFQTHSILKDVSKPEVGYDIILPLIVIYPILLVIFGSRYKWSGWLEKLTGTIV
jgi:uncharacterized protein